MKTKNEIAEEYANKIADFLWLNKTVRGFIYANILQALQDYDKGRNEDLSA